MELSNLKNNKLVKGLVLTGAMAGFGVVASNATATQAHAAVYNGNVATVQTGDTLSEIAQESGASLSNLLAQNNGSSLIHAGDKFTLKGAYATTQQSTQQASTATSYSAPKATTSYNTGATNYSNNNSYAKATTQQASTANTSSASTGNVGSSVASVANAMAARTGTSASTWRYIIMRESGGNGNISNASSGAYGYFQLLGHGEHKGMSAAEQVNMAAKVYKAQGMAAWGM